MSKTLKTIGFKVFPTLSTLATNLAKGISNPNTKTLDLQKDFKNTGYIRKIHSISKKNNPSSKETYHISESTFYRGDQRNSISCNNYDFLLISDYYTSRDMTFFNKLILVQCDFSDPKYYKVICTKEAPFNKTPLRQLESEIAVEMALLDNINII